MRLDKTKQHSFPPGKYYIGDPCYVINGEDWEQLGAETGWFGCEEGTLENGYVDGIFKFKGATCFTHGTAYGDGTYYGGNHEFSVDAGLLSIIPYSAITGEEELREAEHLGAVIEFHDNFYVWYEDGKFYFGHIRINTN